MGSMTDRESLVSIVFVSGFDLIRPLSVRLKWQACSKTRRTRALLGLAQIPRVLGFLENTLVMSIHGDYSFFHSLASASISSQFYKILVPLAVVHSVEGWCIS